MKTGNLSLTNLNIITELGYDELTEQQIAAWRKSWDNNDIIIKAMMKHNKNTVNIFQLNQTYTGENTFTAQYRLKGFTVKNTGEVHTGTWEAYGIPYYIWRHPAAKSVNFFIKIQV